ncbi:AMP-binding protein [Streptomyces tsukubensis]|uniref:Amino acid adenylation protein n=1 Tax=Streptomyces tsukubensis TaxID=83656 RepID=A0A1V3ZZC1_9ACTN|nr:AMP-binding protein [Streptomyces tsukubensis]OON71557.1 amino acid adenylation protein [Streptomyces tsukubensis]QFR96712.1 AMP-binding protein [Streptomyces tsukubensis]
MTEDPKASAPGGTTLWGGAAETSCLLDRLAEIARTRPDNVAVQDGARELTYGALLTWAARIRALLDDHGVRPGDRVAVTGPRGADVVAAMLATVGAGAAYVPLDASYPVRRLEHMAADSAARLLLFSGDAPGFDAGTRAVRVPGAPDRADAPDTTAPAGPPCGPDVPVYVIYTSGSTGLPKGVALPHRCVDNMAAWQWRHSVRPDLRTAQFAPLNFDVWFQEVLGTLCGGGTLVVMPEPLRRDPIALLDWLAEQRVERLFLPYVALHMLAVAAGAAHSLGHLSLAEVNTAGEQLVCTPAVREFFRRLPGCRLNNHYGQSESAMVTVHTLTGPSDSWPALPPIGRPLPGCELLIAPADPADPSVGELLVAGAPLAVGYLDRPALNAERYLDLDEPTPRGHRRAFRTGDLVRVDGDTVHLLGRIDHEVKVRGVRVNPLEVDACLLEQPGVVEAVTVAVDIAHGSRQLRAAVTSDAGPDGFDGARVLGALKALLPEQSVPVSITVVPELPRTASGKADRDAVAAALAPSARRPAADPWRTDAPRPGRGAGVPEKSA